MQYQKKQAKKKNYELEFQIYRQNKVSQNKSKNIKIKNPKNNQTKKKKKKQNWNSEDGK